MKKMFCVACDKFTATALFPYEDMDVEVALKANRLVCTGKVRLDSGGEATLDSTTKVEVNRELNEITLDENDDGQVVCSTCYGAILIAGEAMVEPKETKEERLRREGFNTENSNPIAALTPDFIRKQIQALDSQISEEKSLTKDSIATQFKIARYYISQDKGVIWKEVSLSTYATAERKAGFVPDAMKGPIASQSFDFEGVMGKVVQPKETK